MNIDLQFFLSSISVGIIISFIFYYINEYLPFAHKKRKEADFIIDFVLDDLYLGFVP